ncbi:MAG TPA: TadE/TadG family type IV pilus assembly protein [Rhizomicrobium sp.]|jgi:Flp pilus assembly protein TadG|nr:TadE/TadG family type IV pilus assembly protein [Rhizomicrobium sp.]
MLNRLKQLTLSTRGLAAVEFAILAPVLATLLLGTIEICNALECRQKVTSETASMADLVAQASSVSGADLTNIYNAGNSILYPFAASNATIVVSSIVNTPNGTDTVAWSQSYNGGTTLQINSVVTVPPGVISAGGSAIFVQVTYNYTPPFGDFIFGNIAMADAFYCHPRQSISVTYTG